jgi:beta-lactamase class A
MRSHCRIARTRARFPAYAAALAILCIFRFPAAAGAQVATGAHHDTVLQRRLEEAIAGFEGTVGIYARHLPSGAWAAVNPDTLFPTASMIKVPILLRLFELIDAGVLSPDQKLVYADSLLYEGEDILGSFKAGEEIALSKVAMLMITTSDNTAALWLQGLVGGGEAVNGLLARNGFEHTRVNSRTPGREAARRIYGWGQTTPREMAGLLVMIRQGRAVSPAASEEMYRYLTRIYWDGEALSQIPPWVQAAAKQGAVSRSRSEVVLVDAPGGDYVFCVITKNQEDRTYEDGNEGFVLLRSISRLLWQYFEPDSEWVPPPVETGRRPPPRD